MTSETSKKELRRSPRVVLNEALRFQLDDATEPMFWTGLARNISNGGLFVNTYNIPEIGTHIHVKFKVPWLDEVIELAAEVMWARPEGVAADPNRVGFGACFVGLDAEMERAIDHYLKNVDSEFHDVD